MQFAGLDIGSSTTKCVLVDGGSGAVVNAAHRSTGALARRTVEQVLNDVLGQARDDTVVYCTGYGRELFEAAAARPTEIACLAMGVHSCLPRAGTAIDVGGQDLKVVNIGAGGRHVNFIMNDRCAAGTGRFLEVMARVLEVPLERIGETSLQSSSPVKISSMCTVFAESEVVSLVARGGAVPDILAGVHASVADRIAGQAGRIEVKGEIALAGGGALNPGLKAALEERLGLSLTVPPDPQCVVALGAALLARRDLGSSRAGAPAYSLPCSS
jgi:predicted CoA-substrate-specific enzyme activase